MNDNIQILGTCPLCGGCFKSSVTSVNKKDLIINENNQEAHYKDAKFILAASVSALCGLHGIPMGDTIGTATARFVENIGAEINMVIRHESRICFLIEIKCVECDFVVKRYYTDKIE